MSSVVRFQVSGQTYEIDLAPEKLMGDELMLLDDTLPVGWSERWGAMDLGARDVTVLTYLAARRAGDERPFDQFVKTIAPLTFQVLSGDEAKPANADKPRAKAKAAPLEGPLGPMVRERKTRAKVS